MAFLCAASVVVSAAETPSPWAWSEVAEAVAAGAVPDDLNQAYDLPVTRLECATLAIYALSGFWGISPQYFAEMVDIYAPDTHLADTDARYAKAAVWAELMDGDEDGNFLPEEHLSRQEQAKVLENIRLLTEGEAYAAEPHAWADEAEIADWAKDAIAVMWDIGVLSGKENQRFAAYDTVTREEAIVSLKRLMDYEKNRAEQLPENHRNPAIVEPLRAEDGSLVNSNGSVVLNGVNLGNWLTFETWMSPISDPGETMAYNDILEILSNRFGEKKIEKLLQSYKDNFITESDFAQIEALGFNCVRIPFWYRNFMTADGKWLHKDLNQIEGFRRLDWAIEQANKHGIYVILDMHGCPGGQSMNHSTGIIGKNELYDNEKNLKAMEALWSAIAARYKDEPCIAAYDIMNEPQNNGGFSGERAWQAETEAAISRTNKVYQRMIPIIRKADPDSIITLEGIWSINCLPNPEEYQWDNMMYQLHLYDTEITVAAGKVKELTDAMVRYGTAMYVGEYNNGTAERFMSYMYHTLGISRTKWNYKTVGDLGNWGLYEKNLTKADIRTAKYEELERLLGSAMRTENGFVFRKDEYGKIRSDINLQI